MYWVVNGSQSLMLVSIVNYVNCSVIGDIGMDIWPTHMASSFVFMEVFGVYCVCLCSFIASIIDSRPSSVPVPRYGLTVCWTIVFAVHLQRRSLEIYEE